MDTLRKIGLWVLLAFATHAGFCQRAAARYEIDAKRIGVSPVDKDALPRGREFLRLDSTYYVGWMYQGIYLHDRSVDGAGYQRAIPYLRTAFLLMEKDYSGLLESLYNDPYFYMQNNLRYNDYLVMARALRESYEYLEMPDSAMWVLRQVEKKKFRRDFFGIYGAKAWLIHRNRFYTSAKYNFLGNSVAENEQRALQECYNGFAFIRKNLNQNNLWFGDFHSQMDRQFIYHYLALIHCYLKNYDSSLAYYEQMAEAGTVSWNNYGSMKAEVGEFANAIEMYGRDKYKYGDVKSLMEPYYYLPTLNIYAGNTKEAMHIAREAITFSNSSPGFGWYNIALARSYLYDGQLDSADATLTKAAGFKEIHIGTTLTQPQYDFTIGLLRLVWYNRKIEQHQFLNKDWWYNPVKLYAYAELAARKYTHEYVLATQLALNPERARIIYDLFCGESTVGYDEVYLMMERYSPRYFIKLMDRYLQSDPRLQIRRYFELYRARLLYHTGNENLAQEQMEDLLDNVVLDTAHEKLFLARLYEGLWRGANQQDNASEALRYQNLLFDAFPNLIPFSGIPFRIRVETSGENDAMVRQVVAELWQCNIEKAGPQETGVPVARIHFRKKGAKYEAQLEVSSASGVKKVTGEKFLFMQASGAGKEIALRLFGKSGSPELDPTPPEENKSH